MKEWNVSLKAKAIERDLVFVWSSETNLVMFWHVPGGGSCPWQC